MRDYHHKALWEAENHFTWLLSIIFGAQSALIGFIMQSGTKIWWVLLVLSIIGLLFSIIALRVVRREYEYFRDALHRFVQHYNAAFPDQQYSWRDLESTGVFRIPVHVLGKNPPSISECLQFVFEIFIAVNVLILIVAIVNWR